MNALDGSPLNGMLVGWGGPATRYGVAVSTVRRWEEQYPGMPVIRRRPKTRRGRCLILFPVADLDRWFQRTFHTWRP